MTAREPGAGRRYLMDGDHWRIAHVGEFAAFFRAVHLLDPPAVFVALAAGAWPHEVQESLRQIAIDPGVAVRDRLAREFRQAVYVQDLPKALASPASG